MNEQHEKARAILRSKGYQLINSCDGPAASSSPAKSPSKLEFWSGQRGTIILQLWHSLGVSTYCDWVMGNDWDEFLAALGKPMTDFKAELDKRLHLVPADQPTGPNDAQLREALRGVVNILKAVRYEVGLGPNQLKRLETAEQLLNSATPTH